MSESETEQEQRERREFEGKNVAHYSVLLQAWIDTKMERDRTIVTLSSAGVGLIVTILTMVGTKRCWEIGLYGCAVAGFLMAIAASLLIFHRNSAHIEQAIGGSSEKDVQLEKYDSIQMASFVSGVALLAIVGVGSAFHNLNEESSMNDKAKSAATQTRGILTGDSVNGIGALAPREPLSKSLNGIGSLKPQATQSTATSNQSTGQSGASTQSNAGTRSTQQTSNNQK